MKATSYECIIVGGGIAGLQAALQLGRYMHNVLVLDNQDGRSNLCRAYHNILGWPDGVSGETLRSLGRKQAKSYGVEFEKAFVHKTEKNKENILLYTEDGTVFEAKTLLLSTGIKDRIPNIKNIEPCLGISIYVCPDCDGYEVRDQHVLLLGSGKTGGNLALTLTYWTDKITFINHDEEQLESALLTKLNQKNIRVIDEHIEEIITENEFEFKGVKLKSGQIVAGDKGFIGFGGNSVHSDLAEQLGVERLENKHVLVDPRTKETNITNVWAAGDVVAHSEQVTIAMADGCQAAIWIHKRLLKNQS
ncbi:NAD(P)/FAD-dependent oxidoreductase [Bacillus sp. AFS040349]|uniref:NAD(P)/FAD-dependent oxidoreductase n=1 Tax=Bacillus sp. AFS040349 TaxID=2033502 RepID=UPI000BFBDA8B|nr:NAD(P)/FAD-dependent oxidoreductase [Bacillus sp. AFS040349]PGT90536.1 pyridine nucleotide-disulfide oxidoreductase [Bacillus sp. AFS040349]